MADSGVPFPFDGSNVALVEDYLDLPAGVATRIDVLIEDLLATDVVGSASLAIKLTPSSSDVDATTILKRITTTLSAAGVITETDDPTVRRATFLITARETTRISVHSGYTYSVVAIVTRDAVDTTRMIQKGSIAATVLAMAVDGPVADGTYYADGTLYANGFTTL